MIDNHGGTKATSEIVSEKRCLTPHLHSWFGFPESYEKTFTEYEKSLKQLHRNNEIEFNIVSKFGSYGRREDHILHEYVITNFPSLLATFDVCVSSHAPFDLSVGTFWKSENKAVLAINRGLPTVATRTPAHQRLFAACGLEEYLFSSNDELVALLRRLKAWPERHQFLARSQKFVLENYSSRKMADDWLQLYKAARARKTMHQQSKAAEGNWRTSFWTARARWS